MYLNLIEQAEWKFMWIVKRVSLKESLASSISFISFLFLSNWIKWMASFIWFFFLLNWIFYVRYILHIIRMSHWHQQMVDGAEFWISCKWLKALRKASQSQLIKCSAPSTICWRQCDIRIVQWNNGSELTIFWFFFQEKNEGLFKKSLACRKHHKIQFFSK